MYKACNLGQNAGTRWCEAKATALVRNNQHETACHNIEKQAILSRSGHVPRWGGPATSYKQSLCCRSRKGQMSRRNQAVLWLPLALHLCTRSPPHCSSPLSSSPMSGASPTLMLFTSTVLLDPARMVFIALSLQRVPSLLPSPQVIYLPHPLGHSSGRMGYPSPVVFIL